jgi:exoribonuclease R
MHFGLKTENYCHFSSPIRRFADVYNHYILYGYKYLKLEKSMDEQNRDLILIEKLIENLNYKNMQIKKYNWNMNLIELYDIINTQYGGYYVSNNFKVLYIYSNFYIVNLIDFDIKININNTNNIKDAYIEIATITTKNYILDRLQINIKT